MRSIGRLSGGLRLKERKYYGVSSGALAGHGQFATDLKCSHCHCCRHGCRHES